MRAAFLIAGLMLLTGCTPGNEDDVPRSHDTTMEYKKRHETIVPLLLILGPIYFAPTCIAFARRHDNLARISLVNTLLGYTIAGWAIALIWAISDPSASRQDHVREK